MTGTSIAHHIVLACLFLALRVGIAHADPQLASSYSIKPSDVAVPDDVPLGEYRRIIRPYKNWTLICDENLKKKQRICNVSQSIVDASGAVAFSWSLAATAGGAPMMIVRVPATVGKDQPIRFSFGKDGAAIIVKTADCDQRICIGMLPVDGRLKAHIEKGAVSEVFYVALPFAAANRNLTAVAAQLQTVTVQAPLEGLSAALSGI
jgi:invasion protein IalB